MTFHLLITIGTMSPHCSNDWTAHEKVFSDHHLSICRRKIAEYFQPPLFVSLESSVFFVLNRTANEGYRGNLINFEIINESY